MERKQEVGSSAGNFTSSAATAEIGSKRRRTAPAAPRGSVVAVGRFQDFFFFSFSLLLGECIYVVYHTRRPFPVWEASARIKDYAFIHVDDDKEDRKGILIPPWAVLSDVQEDPLGYASPLEQTCVHPGLHHTRAHTHKGASHSS